MKTNQSLNIFVRLSLISVKCNSNHNFFDVKKKLKGVGEVKLRDHTLAIGTKGREVMCVSVCQSAELGTLQFQIAKSPIATFPSLVCTSDCPKGAI